jgi:serine/threonine-protein kinase
LNHPNIAAIYEELEQADGAGYLVLEYVPGQTLGELMAEGRLRQKEALEIALQIAEALAAAHDHGVIHRDLKPENIKITQEEEIKILDFGLAKAVGEDARQAQTTVTEPGCVLGTPAYMSPEQVRGKEADRRSDIWSFGCVLFEMLAGNIPFDGDTVSDMLAAVLEHEPDFESMPHSIPVNIRALLRRCLAKDPRRRLQHLGDAALEIRETLDTPTSARSGTAPLPAASRSVGWWRWAALAAFVVITAQIGTWYLRPSRPSAQPLRRFTVYPETTFEFEALWHHALALSPDGKSLAYVEQSSDGRRKIYLRRLDEFEAAPLPGTEGAISPFFSPDGEWIGYADHFQRKIEKIPAKGGMPIILAESMNFRGASWAQDDTIIYAPTARTGLWRISASGEDAEQLTDPNADADETGHGWPQILPDQENVLFTNFRSGGPDEYQIETYSFSTQQRRVLFKGGSCARYVPSGHIVYGRNETLYAVKFDLEQLKVTGPHIPVVPAVMTPPSWSAQFAVSGDGTLAYVPLQARSTELTPVWVDRQGKVQPVPGAMPRNYNNARISADGSRIAFDIQDGASRDIWIYDVNHATLSPLTSDGASSFPIWAAAGESVLFASYGDQKLDVFGQSVAGGEPQLAASLAEATGIPLSCSADGTELLVTWSDPNHPLRDDDLRVVPLAGRDRLARPFIQRNHNQRHGVWSPNGQWVKTESAFEVSSIEELFEGRFLSRIDYRSYDVTGDGRFLMIQEPHEPAPLGIRVVLNWFEELRRTTSGQTD